MVFSKLDRYLPLMETVSLTEAQSDRARNLLRRLSADEIHVPTDVVDTWDPPEEFVDYGELEKSFTRQHGFISPSRIQGTFETTVNRLETGRLAKVLKWMLDGTYQVRHSVPPALQKRRDRYFVTSDGHHRCLAAKALELDEFYVVYEEVPAKLLE